MKTLAREGDVAEIRGRLLALQAADAALWGRMSVAEMVTHLRGAFEVALGERPSALFKMKLPGWLVKAGGLWLPVQWPHGVPTVPELRRSVLGEAVPFEEGRAAALAAMERFTGKTDNQLAHPIFGAMSPRDWMRWGYLHTDHHLRQFGR